MKILVIDTSSKAASTALFVDNALLGSCIVNTTVTHSQKLMPLVHTVLEQTQTPVRDIDAFYVCEGPGSFTGVRIGIATAIGMAQPAKKDLYTFSSMFLLACAVKHIEGYVVSVIDAKREDVYYGVYRWREGRLEILEEGVEALSTLMDVLSDKYREASLYWVGDALHVYPEVVSSKLTAHSNWHVGSISESVPKADQLCLASVAAARKTDVFHVKANYMRKSQAERDL